MKTTENLVEFVYYSSYLSRYKQEINLFIQVSGSVPSNDRLSFRNVISYENGMLAAS